MAAGAPAGPPPITKMSRFSTPNSLPASERYLFPSVQNVTKSAKPQRLVRGLSLSWPRLSPLWTANLASLAGQRLSASSWSSARSLLWIWCSFWVSGRAHWAERPSCVSSELWSFVSLDHSEYPEQPERSGSLVLVARTTWWWWPGASWLTTTAEPKWAW